MKTVRKFLDFNDKRILMVHYPNENRKYRLNLSPQTGNFSLGVKVRA